MPENPQLFKRLSDSTSLTDVLIQMEDFIDSLDIYVFKNWFEGEVVDGPEIRRYWVSMTLKYDYEQMPDPAGAERLIRHGVKVTYRRAKEETAVEIESPDDYEPATRKPKMEQKDIWLLEVQIPRRFIEELDDSDLEIHVDDEIVDVEDVSDARDENIDDADAFVKDSNDSTDDETGEP
jgi:hypothetical protein